MNASRIALSGLQAAATRLGVSASNVANANTAGRTAKGDTAGTAYQPLEVDQATIAGQGVAANVVASGKPSLSMYAPASRLADANGIIAMPDVDPVAETMAQIQAVTAYRASLSAMRTSDEMDRALLDSRI